jgi:hypothetical protein
MQESKFQEKDIVVYKGEFAKVMEYLGSNYLGARQYRIVLRAYKAGDPESIVVQEYELKFATDRDIILRGKKRNKCDCGAWATDNPNLHADWCEENNFWIGL